MAEALNAEERAEITERRSKDERVLIYRNLLNGVPVWKAMEMFCKSEKEVMDIFRHVSRALTQYCFQRKMPPVFCDAIAVAQRNKRALLPLLTKVNLDNQPGRVNHNTITPNDATNVLCEMALRG